MPMLPESRNRAPTAQTGEGEGGLSDGEADWLKRAKSAFESSTTYMDSNLRKGWEDSIRAFNNEHPTDSKYNHPSFEKRSKVYRPRIRTVIRKNEAAAAAAFFSNMDVVSVDATDPSDKAECAGADFMKQLLQYRLTKTIPWYQIVLGGLQDAQVTSVACAHIYWEYEAEKAPAPVAMEQAAQPENPEFPQQAAPPQGAYIVTPDGQLIEGGQQLAPMQAMAPPPPPKPRVDRPVVDLLPAENLRIDASASWIDPINTSPYVIHLMPMYVMDVKERIKSGEWREVRDSDIAAATELTPDSTRAARQKDRDDPYNSQTRAVKDYEVVWVQRHIHRKDDEDWEFYTMGDLALLTEPKLLKETVFTGRRPYVMGVCNLETHKVYPSSIPTLGKGLADETNEIANQRADNIKFVLNKGYYVKRGKEADVPGLVRNVPGKVVMLDDPINDVKEMSWTDVTASSFQEAQALGMEMDELLGNFNPASLMVQGAGNSPARNMAMLGNAQGTLVEYMLRTYVETFVQPVLRQLVQLEQQYETDAVVMGLAAKKADLFQKYGVSAVTDDILQRELTLTVNVGMGATDPTARLNKFMTAMGRFTEMLKGGAPGIDMKEVGKEIFGHLGYADGSRFFSGQDPQVLQLQQQVQHAQGVIAQLQKKVAEKQEAHQIALQKTIVTAQSTQQTTAVRTSSAEKIAALKEHGANQRALATHWRALHEKDVNTRNRAVFGSPK